MEEIVKTENTTGLLPGFTFNAGHQELARIIAELEKIYDSFAFNDQGPTGCEWLPIFSVADIICEYLGYEDLPELEDAIKCDFETFVLNLPHIRVKRENGKHYWRIIQDPPKEQWVTKRMSFTVASRDDIWRVVHKNKFCSFEIPHLGFEIQADGVRTIDSIYNLISSSVYKLGDYVRGTKDVESGTEILKTVDALEYLLDVVEPFEIILECPIGNSEICPMDDRVIVELKAAGPKDGGDNTDTEDIPELEEA